LDNYLSLVAVSQKPQKKTANRKPNIDNMSTHEFPAFIIKYPVEFYIDMYNKRFPTHPIFPFILDSEVVERHEDKEAQEIKMKRKIKLDIAAPSWFKSLTGLQYSIFIEDSHFDLKRRKMTIMTVNETFSKKAILTDYSTYEPHPENPEWTIFKQLGKIEILISTLGFNKKIEAFLLETYSRRYDESRKLDEKMIEWYLAELAKSESENAKTDENTNNVTTVVVQSQEKEVEVGSV